LTGGSRVPGRRVWIGASNRGMGGLLIRAARQLIS
jgi:hypothetical protein